MTTDWNNGFDSGILPQSHTNSNPASNVLNNTFELDHEDSTYLRWASSSPVYLPDPMSPDMCYASFMDTMCLSGNLESTPGDGSSASPSSPELASPKLEQKSRRQTQNRTAQRAFRERRRQQTSVLTDRIKELEEANEQLKEDNERSKRKIEELRDQMDEMQRTLLKFCSS